jgi:hypothetical protein
MAFTSETLVRERFQAHDTTAVPQSLVLAAIDDAHTELMRHLDPAHAAEPAPDALALGETLLAGAHLLHALASGDALAQRRVAIGGQRIEEGQRFAALMAAAARAERRAWEMLEPYVRAVPARRVLDATETIPVLGERGD